ncbi:MAG: hypothetical protein ACRDTD_02430 [Pseudonocardiaceae bacterium]
MAPAGEQLDVVSPSDIYFGRGGFSVPEMLDYGDAWAATALVGGEFSFARAVGVPPISPWNERRPELARSSAAVGRHPARRGQARRLKANLLPLPQAR